MGLAFWSHVLWYSLIAFAGAIAGAFLLRHRYRSERLIASFAGGGEREERFRRFNHVLVKLATSRTLTQGDSRAALAELTESAAQALGIERASIWLYDDRRTKIRCIDLYEKEKGRHSEGVELEAKQFPGYFNALL